MTEARFLTIMLAVSLVMVGRLMLFPAGEAAPSPSAMTPIADSDLDLERTGAVMWSSPAEDCYCTCRRPGKP